MTSIFENEHYYVFVGEFNAPVKSNGGEYTRGYIVTNKATGVVEFQVPQQPEAIAAAEQLSMALEQKPWEWARKNIQEPKVNPDGSPVEH